MPNMRELKQAGWLCSRIVPGELIPLHFSKNKHDETVIHDLCLDHRTVFYVLVVS